MLELWQLVGLVGRWGVMVDEPTHENLVLRILREIRADTGETRERVERLEQRLDRVEERLDRVEHRLDRVERRLDGLEAMVTKTWLRVDSLETVMMRATMRLEARIELAEARLTKLEPA